MNGLKKNLSSKKIKSERSRLVKCLVISLGLLAFSSVIEPGVHDSAAATDSAVENTASDINARSYGSKIDRRSTSGRVYLLDMLDSTQDLPSTGRLILLRRDQSLVMAFRVLKQYPDKRQFAAKWLRRYAGTKDLEAGSQYIAIEKVSDKEAPALSSQDKKDLKELEAPAAPVAVTPIPVAPIQAQAPTVPATPAVTPPIAPLAALPPVSAQTQTPAPEAVAPTPEPPTAPIPAPPPALSVPAVAANPVPPPTPEAPSPPEPTAPPAVAKQDLVAPPLAPEPTSSDTAAPLPPAAENIPAPQPAPTTATTDAPVDAAIPPPSAATAENENIPAPMDAKPSKPEEVPDTEGETAAVPRGSSDDLSSIMVEEMKVFDRDENSISVGAGLFLNTLVSGGTTSAGPSSYTTTSTYNSGGLIRYSRTLKHMIYYKSKSLQDSFAIDGSLGFYKYLGQSASGDSYTIVPMSVTGRYTLHTSESFGFFGYLGFVKNVVAMSSNPDQYTQAGFNSLFPEIGVGMLFQIGPSWYMRADLGYNLFALSLALRF